MTKPQNFHACTLHLQALDIINSKKGILVFGAITGKAYKTKSIKILRDGRFISLGEKEEVEAKKVR